jgi:16S rRNA (guanine527-N7)-methyltransferase
MTVSRETGEKLQRYVDLLLAENERQNLISKASVENIWSRHIEDSLQLLEHGGADGRWLDIGSGPGLPGIVLAIAGVRHITLVEPRKLRTEFLERCRDALDLPNVTIVTDKVEQVRGQYDVITARAVASLDRLFALGAPRLAQGGRWVLPKGRSAEKELAEARATWQGEFRLVSSRTDPEARILVAQRVRRRAGRG